MVVQSSNPNTEGSFFDVIDAFFYAIVEKLARQP